MKVLYLHSDFIEIEVKEEAIKVRDKVYEKRKLIEDCLVVFSSIEEVDDENSIEKAVEDIKDILRRIKVNRVVLYPFVHLSNIPANPEKAYNLILLFEKKLKENNIEVYRAPFGWYKQFNIKVKGHPLAELSRTFYGDLDIKKYLELNLSKLNIDFSIRDEENKIILEIKKIKKKEEKKLPKLYLILFPDWREYLIVGEEGNKIKVINWKNIKEKNKLYEKLPEENIEYLDKNIFNDDMIKLIDKEALGKEFEEISENEIRKSMERFGFEWELNSDYGHMRYKPYSSLIVDLVGDYMIYLSRKIDFPVYVVKGTNMFDLSKGPIATHARLFGERMYTVSTDKSDFVLRYAACFQQFLIAKDLVISYKNLPFGMLEIADSYRFEKPGETVLGFRLRKFTMPDLHIFCKDIEEASRVFYYMHKLIMEEMKKIGRDYELLINYASADIYEKYKWLLKDILEDIKKPVLICLYPPADERYWILNIEYHIVDILGRPREIGTTQIDIKNGERFEIKYIDKDNSEKYVIILHNAIIGSVERYIYALFDTALRKEKPELPLWITPVQVRILPISEKYLDYAIKISEELEKNNIRVEIDDRNETLSKKIMDAEKLWIPYIIVIGEKEVNENILSVRLRNGEIKKMKLEDIINEIKEKTKNYPYRPLYSPKLLSIRPANL